MPDGSGARIALRCPKHSTLFGSETCEGASSNLRMGPGQTIDLILSAATDSPTCKGQEVKNCLPCSGLAVQEQRRDLDDFQVAPLSLPLPLWASDLDPCNARSQGWRPAKGTGRWPVGTPPSNLRLAGTFLAWRSAATSAIKRSTPTALWIVWSFASISRTPISRFFSLSTARLETRPLPLSWTCRYSASHHICVACSCYRTPACQHVVRPLATKPHLTWLVLRLVTSSGVLSSALPALPRRPLSLAAPTRSQPAPTSHSGWLFRPRGSGALGQSTGRASRGGDGDGPG